MELDMHLTPTMEKFILHWGEMGSRWGVNRSVAQVHALLYLAGRPLTADEIVETLGIARSNVSTSLRELLSWELIAQHPVLGDRRDFFKAETDLSTVLITIVEGRKRREIDPTLTMLRHARLEAAEDTETPEDIRRRMDEVLEFLESLTAWYEQVSRLSRGTLIKLVKLGAKVSTLVRG
jgi:DNA-binding transcriptional regulator GbsR (MarR family)